MDNTKKHTAQGKQGVGILLLLVLIAISYSNTLTSSWHLDDVPNILWNTPLHLHTLSLSELTKTFFAYPTHPGKLYRPISCLSLALNWFFGQDYTFGYHLVNISIHLLSAFFLYKTIILLLNSPRLKGRYQGQEHCIAALTTIFWAVNPIQTQAVTYIVQRMASLTALFYLLGLYFYISGRITKGNQKEKLLYFFLMTLSFLFALGSKENSIVFPFSVLLIEIIFFNNQKITKKSTLYLIIGLATLVGISTFLLTDENMLQALISYQHRNFTLLQRLLTESRIVCWYLTLIFYPSVTRLSLEHDFQLSTSLFIPVTTFPSILFLLLVSLAGLWGFRKYPIPAFAVLFFLLNHIVESTIIPLELVFEHRNYLPSLFLFWPVSICMVQLMSKYKEQRVMHSIIIAFLSLLISSLAMGTYIRNQVWYTEMSLWTDAVTKAPNNMRAFLNLAYTYEYEGDLQKAFRLNQQAHGKASPTRNKYSINAYNNMGNIMRKMGRYQSAVNLYNDGLKIDAGNKDILFNKFLALQEDGHPWEAKETLLTLLKQDPKNSRYLLAYGNIEIMEGAPEKGMQNLRNALAFSPSSDSSSWQILLSLSSASNKMHQFEKAIFFIHLAGIRGAPDFFVGLYTLENHILSKSQDSADHQIKTVLSHIPLAQLHKKIVFGLDNIADMALEKKVILDYINNWIGNQITQIPNK